MAVTESIRMVLCALETYLYPHTVLRKRQAAHVCAPVRLRFGGGAAHGHHQGLSLYGQEREQASNPTHRVWAKCLGASEGSSTHEVSQAKHGGQAAPVVTQLGGRLACSPPLTLEKGIEIEHDPPCQHVIDRPRKFMRQDRQGLALPVFVLKAG